MKKKIKKPTQKAIKEFLTESNAIESVFDSDSFNQAKLAWEFLMTQEKMSPQVVMETHKILMAHPGFSSDQGLDKKYVGHYRDYGIWVGGRLGMYFADIPGAIIKWSEKMNADAMLDGQEAEAVLSQALHVEYEKIHPFGDGNGRTGRMFMNWYRLQKGMPILIIHAGDEQMKYYDWFKP